MIRLQVAVPYWFFIDFANKFLSCNPDVEYWDSFKLQGYRFNYRINISLSNPFNNSIENVSFYLAYKHNTEKQSDSEYKKYNLVLEYNPNKCYYRDGLLFDILIHFFGSVSDVIIKSFDIAFDYDVHINNFIYDRCSKRKELDYRSNGGRTIYIGSRGSNGSTKIYDKAVEQGIKNKDWTRIEVTFKTDLYISQCLGGIDLINIDCNNIPFIYVLNTDIVNKFDIVDKCCLLALLNKDVSLSEFSRKLKDKYKKILSTYCDNKIDSTSCDEIKSCLNNYVFVMYNNLFSM